ncbi:MAG: type 1 glutamine amidotransferase domain-containing protein, partial [Fusobacteriaceae bacterium]
IDITIVSLKGGDVPIDPASLNESHQNPLAKIFLEDDMNLLKNTLSLDKIDYHQYDAVFYPGGHGPMWDLSESEENGKLVSDFFNNGKIVSAVCHGTAAFLKGINDRTGEAMIKNRNITGFSNSEEIAVGLQNIVPFLLETKIKELGGKYWKGDQNFSSYVVIDGPIFTGQNPASGILVAEKIIEELYS